MNELKLSNHPIDSILIAPPTTHLQYLCFLYSLSQQPLQMNIQSEALLARSRLLAPSKAQNRIPIGTSAQCLAMRSEKFLSSISFLSTDEGSRYLARKGLSLSPLQVQEAETEKQFQTPCEVAVLQSAEEFCDEANDARLNALLNGLHKKTALALTLTYQKALQSDWQEKIPNLGLLTAAAIATVALGSKAFVSLDAHYAPLLICYAHIVKQMNSGKISLESAAESFLYHSQAFCTEKKYEPVVGLWRFLSLLGAGESVKNPSCTFLESLYAEHIAQTVAQHPRAMRAGTNGEISILDRVISYSRIFIQANSASIAIGECVPYEVGGGLGSEVSFWATLYFLIRAGYHQEALQWIQNNNKFIVDQSGLRESLSNWLEQGKTQSVSKAFYEGSLDTFKSLILRLISPPTSEGSGGFLEEEKKKKNFSSIINKTECYVWFQLRTSKDPQGLAAHFASLGPSYFGNGLGATLLYVLILGLVGLWDEAIQLLVDKTEFQVDAIHMALWLWSINKIRPNAGFTGIASKWLMNFDGGELAVQYPLALSKSKAVDSEVVEDQLAFIVAHSQSFGSLIGPNGLLADSPGVALKAANFCLRSSVGHSAESQAVILFHTAGAYERVVELLVKQGKRLILSKASLGEMDKFIEQASSLVEFYQKKSLSLRSLEILIVLGKASVAFAGGRFEECMTLVDSLGLLPEPVAGGSERMHQIRQRSQDLGILLRAPSASLGIPLVEWLLVLVERCFCALASSLPHRLLDLRGRSRDLICFASMLLQDEEAASIGMQVFGELTRLDNEIAQ